MVCGYEASDGSGDFILSSLLIGQELSGRSCPVFEVMDSDVNAMIVTYAIVSCGGWGGIECNI
jgi:hypothetical protein